MCVCVCVCVCVCDKVVRYIRRWKGNDVSKRTSVLTNFIRLIEVTNWLTAANLPVFDIGLKSDKDTCVILVC